jgi:hypothetical protein
MLISIRNTVIDYDGPGCYNLNTGERVHGLHLHNDGANGIEYVDLNHCTHTLDLPRNYFWIGFGLGLVIAAGTMLACILAGIV